MVARLEKQQTQGRGRKRVQVLKAEPNGSQHNNERSVQPTDGLSTCSVWMALPHNLQTGSLAVVHPFDSFDLALSAARRANNTRSFTYQLPVAGERLALLGVMRPLVAVARVETWDRVS
jgi:hypothetical protein